MKGRGVLVLVLLSTDAAWGGSADPLPVSADGEIPIEITADRLQADGGKARFESNVTVRRGDVTLTCDRLEAEYDSATRQVAAILATGSVRILRGDQMATGERASYTRKDDTAILEGDAVVFQGDNRIEGRQIRFRFAQRTFEVVQPKARFTPPVPQPPHE